MFGFINRLRASNEVDDVEARLVFSKKLQAVTNKIHATSNLDQLMLDLTQDICDLFNCDRLTLYALSKDKEFIFSKIKTGIHTNNDLVLPVGAKSIAGWVAQTGNSVRIRDVYDKSELKAYDADLTFNREVDRLTGYRTKQMLAAPLFKANTNELLGVIQLLNNRDDDSFSAGAEEGLNELCETMAIAFTQRMRPPAFVSSKYDALVANAIIAQPEMELAVRSARRQNLDVEDVLIDEFQVPQSAIGQALAQSLNLPYQSYNPKWKKPEQALKKIGREFVEVNRCLPIEDDGKSMTILTTDPDRVIRLGIFKQQFPYASLFYRVTTNREFKQAAELFFDSPIN
ncbi:MAG: GAF domain-containing protein [Burkholderiaceae bacterium]